MKSFLSMLAMACLLHAPAKAQQIISAQAQAEAGKNNFALAIAELDAILAKDAKNEIALTYRANFFNSAGLFDKALSDAEKAIALQPNNLNALIVAGSAKVSLKFYMDALKYFSSAVTIKPDLVVARMMRAKTYVQTNQLKNAINDFDEIIKQDSKNIEAHLLRGRMYIRNEEPQFALADYVFVRENTQSGTPVWEAATKEFALAEKLYEKAKQVKSAAIIQQMAAAESANSFSTEMAIIKERQDVISKAIADASAELNNLKNAPADDYFKQANVREAARPKLIIISAMIEKAIAATSNLKSEFSISARDTWKALLVNNNLTIEKCSEYTVKSNRIMGALKESTDKNSNLAKQVYAARDAKDKGSFDRNRLALIDGLKQSIKIASEGYDDLSKLKNAALPEFKAYVDSLVATKTKDLQYFDLLKMP